MRWTTIAVLAACLCTPSHAGEQPLGVGQVRLGMSYDQVRAALPQANWCKGDGAYCDTDGRVISTTLPIEGMNFLLTYRDEGWDRYQMELRSWGVHEMMAVECRKRVTSFIAAVENASGPLRATETYPNYDGTQEVIRVGTKSQAMLRYKAGSDAGFGIEAVRAEGAAKVVVRGGSSGRTCGITAEFSLQPPRPPQRMISFDDLEITQNIGIGAIHHSLDAGPPPPPQGIDIELECTINNYGGRLSCRPAPDSAVAALPFAKVAQFRAEYIRVTRRTRDGRWTPEELTRLRVHIAPGDRRTVGPIDFSKTSLLRMVGKSPPPRFPMQAAEAMPKGLAASVEARCVVQSDGSLICSELDVKAERFADEFKAAVLRALLTVRFEPLLGNGESALGVGYRTTMDFRID